MAKSHKGFADLVNKINKAANPVLELQGDEIDDAEWVHLTADKLVEALEMLREYLDAMEPIAERLQGEIGNAMSDFYDSKQTDDDEQGCVDEIEAALGRFQASWKG